MQLDRRSNNLLKEVLTNPQIKSISLESKYELSRRQISYSFEKINHWLLTKNLPPINRNRQGMFLIEPILIETLLSKQENNAMKELVLTEETRIQIILLMMISQIDETLSLNHFTHALDVSKNTVLHDIKQAQLIIQEDDLTIHYSRKAGYYIEGEEFFIRKLLVHLINRLLFVQNKQLFLSEIMRLSNQELVEMTLRVERIENQLNLKFTDEKIDALPFSLIIILKRIRAGMFIGDLPVKHDELTYTKEWQAVYELFDETEHIPDSERVFFTLHLLITNIYWSDLHKQDIVPSLMIAINEMLTKFEKYACMVIKDRDQLINKLLIHVKPAYYRIKFELTDIDQLHQPVGAEFSELQHLVKKAITPLAQLIGQDIPDHEITYLSMLIGGWLARQGEHLNKKIKAVIVCPKGVSVSKMMDSVLKEIFPEFVFLDSLSVREFYQFQLDYDIVFSLIHLETDRKVFIVKSFPEKEEKLWLRQQVMGYLYGYSNDVINVEELINVIEKDATILNKTNLTKRIYSFINQQGTSTPLLTEEEPTPHLAELIPATNITLRKNIKSWNEAIRVTAQPLLRKGAITHQYVDAVIEHCQEDPYIVIGDGLAIPHASPENGVLHVGMSLLRIEEGVTFAHDYSIKIIILIAALDKHQHFKALTELLKLAGTRADLLKIKQAKVKKEITDTFKKYQQL
ncbi:Transcriptional antiterminator [Amphibacillus marinus]|uniref:Ascorbate-specific PTS system EIIA component n=1 Tax=Amphibacillus marinus TaxID=872970 RepID=A0A1H8PIM8_9BACI|nr:BglG family transcription antiterminator [Amphibacillus marinus]SEO41557.1 Transcriptional antiterminator [Amphibacillus marinus]